MSTVEGVVLCMAILLTLFILGNVTLKFVNLNNKVRDKEGIPYPKVRSNKDYDFNVAVQSFNYLQLQYIKLNKPMDSELEAIGEDLARRSKRKIKKQQIEESKG